MKFAVSAALLAAATAQDYTPPTSAEAYLSAGKAMQMKRFINDWLNYRQTDAKTQCMANL